MVEQPHVDDEQAAADLSKILDRDDGDRERIGVDADRFIAKLLRAIGYERTAEVYEQAELWRA